jgi:hypothetical protein
VPQIKREANSCTDKEISVIVLDRYKKVQYLQGQLISQKIGSNHLTKREFSVFKATIPRLITPFIQSSNKRINMGN